MRTADEYIETARCPASLKPQSFGPWSISRLYLPEPFASSEGVYAYTVLSRHTSETIHLPDGEVVMEDTPTELRRHLPIWMKARGRVLVTGLGLGCVVRGLLASDGVEHVDCVEIDRGILDAVGPEFAKNPRVTLIEGDARTLSVDGRRWDFAWHDIWVEPEDRNLSLVHLQMINRFADACPEQGAWNLPRFAKRLADAVTLG